MDNMYIYNNSREVPKEALKEIKAGRLKGMSDINPMWRIKKLTELFGPCGIGWKIEIVEQRIVEGEGYQKVCFVDINLYFKHNNVWSEPIPGTGGSSFVAKENAGPYVSDECFKMAQTDAISVACKMLGIAADVYFEKDRTKYTSTENNVNVEGEDDNNKSEEIKIKNEIKEKYIKIHGDDKGLVDYVKSQQSKGYNYKQINAYLVKQLTGK